MHKVSLGFCRPSLGKKERGPKARTGEMARKMHGKWTAAAAAASVEEGVTAI